MGEVLISFWLLQTRAIDTALTAPKDINPHLRRAWIDVHIVGLRNLLGARRPYLQFDVASQSYGDTMKTAPSKIPSATNPNYLERLIIDTKLPEDPLYAPCLEIKCFDARVSSNVILGKQQHNDRHILIYMYLSLVI